MSNPASPGPQQQDLPSLNTEIGSLKTKIKDLEAELKTNPSDAKEIRLCLAAYINEIVELRKKENFYLAQQQQQQQTPPAPSQVQQKQEEAPAPSQVQQNEIVGCLDIFQKAGCHAQTKTELLFSFLVHVAVAFATKKLFNIDLVENALSSGLFPLSNWVGSYISHFVSLFFGKVGNLVQKLRFKKDLTEDDKNG